MIYYPDTLPLPTSSYTLTTSESFKTSDTGFAFKKERIHKKYDTIKLNFSFNKLEYIEFIDFYQYEVEVKNDFVITVSDSLGKIKKCKGTTVSGIDVVQKKNRFSVSFTFLIKHDIIN